MFKRFFVKYARAVSNENERKSLYQLYCIKTIVLCLFLVFCIAIIVESLIIGKDMSLEEGALHFLVFGLTLFLWLGSAAATLASWLAFRFSYRKILNRAPSKNEIPEVVSYRQKTKETKKSFLKSIWWAIVLFAVGIVCMIVMIAVDIIQNPDSEDLTPLSEVGIGIFGVCFGIFLISLFLVQSKRATEGKTVEMQTEKEAKIIDEAQGRKHKYSLAEDNNAQTYRYLFPNSDLYAQVVSLRTKQVNATLAATMISCIVGIAVSLIFFSPIVFDWRLSGFAFPVFMTIVFFGTFFVALPYSYKQLALEKRQKEELESYPIYGKNLTLYRKYEVFSKGKGRILHIFILISFVLGYALAIFFPDKLWSLFSIVPLFLGIVLNNKFLSDLRKEALLVEEAIDRMKTEVKFRVFPEEALEAAWDVKVSFLNDALFTETGGKIFPCHFYFGTRNPLFLGMDNETKRIGEMASAFFRDDMKRKSICFPENFTVGGLYLDGEEKYPPFYRQEITFEGICAYDPENKIMQFGHRLENQIFYKIFRNAYVQLSDEGYLKCILITDILI